MKYSLLSCCALVSSALLTGCLADSANSGNPPPSGNQGPGGYPPPATPLPTQPPVIIPPPVVVTPLPPNPPIVLPPNPYPGNGGIPGVAYVNNVLANTNLGAVPLFAHQEQPFTGSWVMNQQTGVVLNGSQQINATYTTGYDYSLFINTSSNGNRLHIDQNNQAKAYAFDIRGTNNMVTVRHDQYFEHLTDTVYGVHLAGYNNHFYVFGGNRFVDSDPYANEGVINIAGEHGRLYLGPNTRLLGGDLVVIHPNATHNILCVPWDLYNSGRVVNLSGNGTNAIYITNSNCPLSNYDPD